MEIEGHTHHGTVAPIKVVFIDSRQQRMVIYRHLDYIHISDDKAGGDHGINISLEQLIDALKLYAEGVE